MEAKEIWDTFDTELRQYVKRRVKDENAADDIVQEIFENVIRNIQRLNEVENIQEYLYKRARNTVIDSFRFHKSRIKESIASEGIDVPDIENEALK